jgi:hypothetical protein
MALSEKSSANVVIGRSRNGEVISSFKSAKGGSVRVLSGAVYLKATTAAGKVLRQIQNKKRK